MGLPADKIHDYDVPTEDRAHYSKHTIDVMFDYPNGQEELLGFAYRTALTLAISRKLPARVWSIATR